MSVDNTKLLEQLKSDLKYWEDYQPVNLMGKLARQTKIDNIKYQIKDIESETKIIKLKTDK